MTIRGSASPMRLTLAMHSAGRAEDALGDVRRDGAFLHCNGPRNSPAWPVNELRQIGRGEP